MCTCGCGTLVTDVVFWDVTRCCKGQPGRHPDRLCADGITAVFVPSSILFSGVINPLVAPRFVSLAFAFLLFFRPPCVSPREIPFSTTPLTSDTCHDLVSVCRQRALWESSRGVAAQCLSPRGPWFSRCSVSLSSFHRRRSLGFARNVFESSLSVNLSLFVSDLLWLFLEVFPLSSASLLPLSFHVFLHGHALLLHTPPCPTFPCLSTLILFSLPYIHCFNCLRRATLCYYRMELPYPLDCCGAQMVVWPRGKRPWTLPWKAVEILFSCGEITGIQTRLLYWFVAVSAFLLVRPTFGFSTIWVLQQGYIRRTRLLLGKWLYCSPQFVRTRFITRCAVTAPLRFRGIVLFLMPLH